MLHQTLLALCTQSTCYDIIVDILVPIITTLIGCAVTIYGIRHTIRTEKENENENIRQAAKPWLFSLNPLEEYDSKSTYRIIMSGSAQHGKNQRLAFIIKNTDNGVGIIEKFETEKTVYVPKVGRILDKNTITEVIVILDVDETLNDMYLYVNDIYGNTYRYKAFPSNEARPGNHIEEFDYVPAKKLTKSKC